MKRLLLVIIGSFILATLLISQDVIVKKNGKKIKCVVLEETPDAIKYKKYRDQNGPIFKISKEKVYTVEYEVEEEISNDHAQQDAYGPTPLTYNNGFWGLAIRRGDKKLNTLAVKELYKDYPKALSEYKSGKTINTFGNIIGVPSAYFVGYGLVTLLFGGEVNGVVLAISGAGMAIGITMTVAGTGKIKRSVEIYNQAIEKTAKLNIQFGLTSHGVGLCLRF